MSKRLNTCLASQSLLVSAVSMALFPLTAAAQQDIDADAGAQLEEIIVTARKQEVDLQDAPVAVSVVSGLGLETSNVRKLDDLNGYAPGLVVAKNDGAGRVVTIRGIGWETAQNLTTQPSVLAYIDGIYLSNPLAMGLFFGELERVEVFRGPQGTEFGQGTTGGAINLVTKKPELDVTSGYLQGGVGTYNARELQGMVNLPLGDSMALRATVQSFERDGFAEIKGGELDGYDLDDADALMGKVALMWQPTDRLSVRAQVVAQDSDQNAAAQKNIDDPNPDNRELTQDFPGIFELQNTSASLTIEWEAPNGIIFRSLTGYQDLEKRQSVDGDRLTEDTFGIDIQGFGAENNWDVLTFWDNASEAFSQEFNFLYSGDKLSLTGGVYYLDDENFNQFLEATGAAPFTDSIEALANPGPDTLPPFQSVLNFVETRTVTRESIAYYGQATYELNDMFNLTGGVRYQKETLDDVGEQFFGVFGSFDRNSEDDKVTWKLGVDVSLTDNNLVYGLISTGWKNGGNNGAAIDAVFLPVSFDPEELTSYEVGSRNTLLGGRAQLNVTAFYYDHENLHFVFEDPVPFAGGTGALPEVEEYGIETEFRFQISDSWRLDGMFAWQDGEIKENLNSLDPVDFREALAPGVGLFTSAGFDLRFDLATNSSIKGNEPAKMPDLLGRLALTNEASLGGGSLVSRLEVVHRGEMQARVFNNPLVDTVPDYTIANLSFDYTMADYPINMRLLVSNLTDKDGINNTFSNPFGVWSTSNEFIPPREVMFSVRYSWD